MNKYTYRKVFKITDQQAKELEISIEAPIVCFYQDTKGRVFLTASYVSMRNKVYEDIFECTMRANHWLINMFFPFPWEDNYKFKKRKKGIYQLINTTATEEEKEYITYVRPKTKTIPTTRCRKTTKIQNMCKPKPSAYGENPKLTDTLQ